MAYCGLMTSFDVPIGERLARAPVVDLLPPRRRAPSCRAARAGAPQPHHVLEHMRAVADDRDVDLDVLVDRRRIDIDVDLLRARREGVEPAGDAVVEARADADHHVAIVHRHVGFVGAVHAEHAEPLRIGRRIGAEPHQRRGDREAGELDQFAQQLACRLAGIDRRRRRCRTAAAWRAPSARSPALMLFEVALDACGL